MLPLTGASDVVDGFAAVTAAEHGATVITSDTDDIRRLLHVIGVRVPILQA